MNQDNSNIEESEKSEDINNNININSIQIDADKKYEECSSINYDNKLASESSRASKDQLKNDSSSINWSFDTGKKPKVPTFSSKSLRNDIEEDRKHTIIKEAKQMSIIKKFQKIYQTLSGKCFVVETEYERITAIEYYNKLLNLEFIIFLIAGMSIATGITYYELTFKETNTLMLESHEYTVIAIMKKTENTEKKERVAGEIIAKYVDLIMTRCNGHNYGRIINNYKLTLELKEKMKELKVITNEKLDPSSEDFITFHSRIGFLNEMLKKITERRREVIDKYKKMIKKMNQLKDEGII